VLRPLRSLFSIQDYPALLVGLSSPDDAAVYRLNAEQAIVSTVDFFPPVVDDAYAFGAIAAANAMSDIYAMGGEVVMAINLAAFPDNLDKAVLGEILRGGAEKVREAGGVIAGGHTITDSEPKYGLAVTGVVHPDRILTKGGAQPGDQLVLTKRLGTGVITTAHKNDRVQSEHIDTAIAGMARLNREASRAARQVGVHAMTDITGYSLLGHSHEMAHLSQVNFRINYRKLKWLPGAQLYAQQNSFPGGMERNRVYFDKWIIFDESIPDAARKLLFDPQTSGGLLMAVAPERANDLLARLAAAGDDAALIGSVQAGEGIIVVAE
jgi:selenide,water dikinase